jgi:aarF domain-containing kinase
MSRGRIAAALGGTAMVAGSLVISRDEGQRRAMTFWMNIGPVYAHYRCVQFLNRDTSFISDDYADKWYDQLHENYSPKIEELTWKMRGFYLKQAQLMSTQDDFVPKEYMTWMKKTQDSVPSEFQGVSARDYVTKVMKEELGQDFDDVFSSWEDEPLGVASIGEVHKATLKKNGKTVAVKFLMPGIEPRFRADIQTLKMFCAIAMPQHLTALDEIERQFCTEFDYTFESKNCNTIRKNMLPKWGHVIDVPEAHEEYCSKTIMVMDFLEGRSLVKGIMDEYRELAKLGGKNLDEVIEETKAKIANGTFVFKSLEQQRRETTGIQWQLWCHDLLLNMVKVTYNYSLLRLMFGPTEYTVTKPPLDVANIVETLCKVHATQIFDDGYFNGDCHPGNFMLLSNNKLGLIDFGQIKQMTPEEREKYARLILAHYHKDKEAIIDMHFNEVKVQTKYKDPEIGYLMSCFYNDRDTYDVCKGMNIASFIDYLEAKDPMIQIPEQYVMVCRVSLLLRGLGKAFGLQLRMSELWKQSAEEYLKKWRQEHSP